MAAPNPVSSTIASATPTASNSACATQSFSEFPTRDSACSVGGTSGFPSNYRDIFDTCCKSAPVETWSNDCALYCLSVDQNVGDLQKCFQDEGIQPALIQCNSASNATATGSPSSTNGASRPSSSGESNSNGDNQEGAAMPVQGVTKAGLSIMILVVVSAVFGSVL
jgi:hypothetical protein